MPRTLPTGRNVHNSPEGSLEPLERLTRDGSDGVEVLVIAKNCEPGQLGGRGDEQMSYRRSTMQSSLESR